MIWHIFKKDWKLEWRLAVLLASVQFANTALTLKLSPFGDNPSLRSLWQLLTLAAIVGIPFLIAAVVHQDAVPGARQDWLARPIQRRDLLLAKLLFILVAIHGPMLLADLFRGLANGFAFGPSLAAAVSRGAFVFLAFSVPLFAFASLTKNTMEAIAAALFAFLCFAGFGMTVSRSLVRDVAVGASGLSWIEEVAMILVGLAGAAAVLGLQYFRRRTMIARVLASAAAVLAGLCIFFPWNAAFAIQQRMSPNPGAASAVAVTFDPGMGRLNPPFDDEGRSDYVAVPLPLRFENLPAGSALISDRFEVRLRDSSGVFTTLGFGPGLSTAATGEEPAAYLLVNVPGDLYQRIQDQSGPLEIDLSLTLFRSMGVRTLPALNGSAHFPDLGSCMTRLNAAQSAIRVGCMPLEFVPSCLELRLQHVPSGRVNPPMFQCQGDYAPFFDALFVGAPPSRTLPFRDLTGLAKYPVDGPQLSESQIVIEPYQPVDHFTRTVVIPSTRVKDWAAR